MKSMEIMGWVSILIALSILGMGGAPIAEKFDVFWLMHGLKWMAYLSIALLCVATFLIGGMGIYHGILTVLGKEVGTVRTKPTPAGLPAQPQVEESQI